MMYKQILPIERETKVKKEAKKVSSVIHKRIKKAPYLLQLCSTIQYISICKGEEVKEHLLIDDTKVDDLYNTYLHKKLPPGPICSPGFSSIEAALYPDETGLYYFVNRLII